MIPWQVPHHSPDFERDQPFLTEERQGIRQGPEETHATVILDDDERSRAKRLRFRGGSRRFQVAEREQMEKVDVPVVPETRGTRTEQLGFVSQTPLGPRDDLIALSDPDPNAPGTARAAAVNALSSHTGTVTGLISATEKRATAEARHALVRAVVQWLEPDVPGSWTPPARLLDAMVRKTRISPEVKDYGTMYVAELTVDVSPQRRAALIEAYNRELVQHRMVSLGGMLSFVLICLGVICGYIRADEASKGYYTNRLRILAAMGVGASAVIIYQLVA